MEAYPPPKLLFGRAPSPLAFALPSDRRSINSHRISTEFWVSYVINLMLLSTCWFCNFSEYSFLNAAILRPSLCFNLGLLSFLFVNMFVHCLPTFLKDTCQTFGSTSSMLDHGLQQLLHALTHDTVSGDSSSVKATAPNITVRSGISHHRFFKTCPHFHRTARRHRSSIQFRARVCRVLDHRSERLTENAAYTRSRRSAPLGQIQLDVVEYRWHSKTFPRQHLPGPYSGSQFGIASIGTPPFNVNPFDTVAVGYYVIGRQWVQVCDGVHTSKWEFSDCDALVLRRSVFATKLDHLNGFPFDGRCTCRYCCTGRLRINQLLSNTILPGRSRSTRVGSPPPKSVAWPVRATNKLIPIYYVPRKGFHKPRANCQHLAMNACEECACLCKNSEEQI